MRYLLTAGAGLIVLGCGPGTGGSEVTVDALGETRDPVSSITGSGAAAWFSDTVATDEGFMLIKHRASGSSSLDSIDVFDGRVHLRSVRLNNGGYQGEHTRLIWSNRRFLCFGYGCGSPCWGVQLVDLEGGDEVRQIDYTVHVDSVFNIVCYPDTAWFDDVHTGFVVENIVTGRKRTALLGRIDSATPAAEFDSAWVSGTDLHLRHRFSTRTEVIDLKGVL